MSARLGAAGFTWRTITRDRRPRHGRRLLGLALLPVILLAIGCQTPTRTIDPADRQLEPPPFARFHSDDTAGDIAAADDEPSTWPNIRDPGPDMANFPNAAFTIPRGAAHVELAPVTLSGPSDRAGPTYSTQFLLRYGLTDRLELRLFGLGYTAVFNSRQATTGFAPLAFDLKMNLWGESPDKLIPAAGLEVYLLSEFGSPAFRSGTQPGLALLFDHSLPLGFEFEWNVGVNGAQRPLFVEDGPNGPVNLFQGPEVNAYEWNLQWALQRQLFDQLDVFTHGYLNSSAIPFLGDGVTVGGGAIWSASDRLALFGSYNAGLTGDAPTTFFQLGGAWAF